MHTGLLVFNVLTFLLTTVLQACCIVDRVLSRSSTRSLLLQTRKNSSKVLCRTILEDSTVWNCSWINSANQQYAIQTFQDLCLSKCRGQDEIFPHSMHHPCGHVVEVPSCFIHLSLGGRTDSNPMGRAFTTGSS